MQNDYALNDHKRWINYLVPEGLVVSARALMDSQVVLDRDNLILLQGRLREVAGYDPDQDPGHEQSRHYVSDLPNFFARFLGWPLDRLVGFDAKSGTQSPALLPPELTVPLPDLGTELTPTYALRDPAPAANTSPWQLLIHVLPPATEFDLETTVNSEWKVSPSRKIERHLREVGVTAGLLTDGRIFRLMSAPRGETAGWMDFNLDQMVRTVDARPMVGGLHLLLSASRLFVGKADERLPGLLIKSRRWQSEVSTRLAEQVLEALYELVRGFDAADRRQKGAILAQLVAADTDHVYGGMLSVLMRLVFLLYAEDRGLMPDSKIWHDYYSVHGLFHRLREDVGRFPDTMDSRFGAWAALVTLFRLIHGGSDAEPFRLPARQGHLFDPDRYAFLEGRTPENDTLPLISDGVVYRILDKLLVLDGEKLSYRTLDVEQIGSVYETMMGFGVVRIPGQAAALKPVKKSGAPVAVDLSQLVACAAKDRVKFVKDATERAITGIAARALKEATTAAAAFDALGQHVARAATPRPTPPGSLLLQPSTARRRSGSHYTPRSLTSPIVTKALAPQLTRLGANPSPAAILSLRVLDPTMGSGAFLVEACRQLAEELVRAWRRTKSLPKLPPDEDELLAAMREVARQCLYGVDKNPMAVDLAKLSLWLVTLAKNHAFTFIDHALRHGDSLIGLLRDQVEAVHWDATQGEGESLFMSATQNRMADIAALRDRIRSAGDEASEESMRAQLRKVDEEVRDLHRTGDYVVAAYFGSDKDAARKKLRNKFYAAANAGARAGKESDDVLSEAKAILSRGNHPITPFHWPLEFPEVFLRENPGFDAIVGNPPFAGKNTLAISAHELLPKWLKVLHPESHGNSDVVAHFFRRSFNLVRASGTLGLIATKTIAQGDTRSTGLRYLCTHGGTIYSARRRLKWEGAAAVVVSVLHIVKGDWSGNRTIDDEPVERITAFLLTQGGDEDPPKLAANRKKAFVGSYVLGMGFTFDDTDTKGEANSIAEMERLIRKDPRNKERIFPYIGGEEVNTHPQHEPHRFVINFEEMSAARAKTWPDLWAIVDAKIRRAEHSTAERWQFERLRPELYRAIARGTRVVVRALTSKHFAFTFLPRGYVYDQTLLIWVEGSSSNFAALSSRAHEVWSLTMGGTLKNDPRYNLEGCFETFPFPESMSPGLRLESIGKLYFDHRAALMTRLDEGLTKIYNRFHNPDETDADVLRLRELHGEMDRAVLAAYGWSDIPTVCEFIPEGDDEDDDEESETSRKRKYRYRWPDEVREKVLARLLALNAERHEAEVAAEIVVADAEDEEDEEAEDEE